MRIKQMFAMIVTLSLLTGAFAAPSFAQDKKEDAKELKKQATEKVKEFNKTKKKTEDDWIAAIEKLGETQHEEIRKQLSKLLKSHFPSSRRAAASQMAKYENDAKAALDLFKMVNKEKDADTAVRYLECIAQIKHRPMAKNLMKLFEDRRRLDVAEAAISACGELKSKIPIDNLISLLKELEAINEDPYDPGAPPIPGGGGLSGNNRKDDEIKRKNQLMGPIQGALKSITGEKHTKAMEWERWWRTNKKKFKELKD